ncbi:MAG: DEAD/DEAH box helicase [Nitrospiraceae bacterium]|nr:DEAD/DEAH box helicase [Nitrospiraceae bacterium]
MDIDELPSFGAPPRLAEILSATGLKTLYPTQEAAVREGLFENGGSFVVSAPTASGKTLVAEMAALSVFLRKAGKIIYLVPLRALAREKYEEFTHKYKAAGMKVVQSTGDFDSEGPWLAGADIIICTNEKLDSLIRHRAPWLGHAGLIVTDEVHLLGDGHRGPTLEVVLTRLRYLNPRIRVLALSATIPNSIEIAEWLGAKLVESDWRPVPLREGVFFNGAAIFNDGAVDWVPSDSGLDALDLALETIKQGGQALVFVGTRKSAEALAKKSLPYVRALLEQKETEELLLLQQKILEATSEPTRLCKKLAECAAAGAAFHHAGIIYAQRKLIEDAFRANRIKLLASTTTLAMGLNLPSRRVIIRDWWRYEPGMGMQSIPVIEARQMSGRAGRPGYDKFGEAVMIAKNKRDEQRLFEKYIKGEPERIESRLGSAPALRTHILASIAGMFTTDMGELMEFLGRTFFAHQGGAGFLSPIAKDIIGFLSEEGMIKTDGRGEFKATRFGHRVSELYIDPLSAVIIREALATPKEKSPFPVFHMLARTPDMMHVPVRKKDRDEMMEVFSVHASSLLLPDEDIYLTEDILSELKTASVLMQWILETPEENIVNHFGIGPGDLRTLVELADWLLYSSGEICKVLGPKEAARGLGVARIRVNYGVKEELLPLVGLRGIGRVRARALFDAGFPGLEDIGRAGAGQLAQVPGIGEAIAQDIKKQVQGA